MMGELKAAINKKVSEFFKDVKKKLKSLFSIFVQTPDNDAEDDNIIDEAKRLFELKTFIHELYQKINQTEKDLEDEHF